MRVIVFGAGGRTGRLVVERLIAAGHDASAFVRGWVGVDGARLVAGDARDERAVIAALEGQDSVIDTVGGKTPYRRTDLEASIAANIVAGMREHGTRRLVAVSAMGVGDSMEQAPFWYEHLLVPTWLRGSTRDKTAMEQTIKASGLEHVIVRPAALTEGDPTGRVHVIAGSEKGYKTVRSDLARFLVDQLGSDEHLGRAVTLVSD